MNELTKRIIVSIIGIPIAMIIIYQGGWLFAIAVALISSVAVWEFFLLTEKKGIKPFKRTAVIINTAIILVLYYLLFVNPEASNYALLILSFFMFIVLFILMLVLFTSKQNALMNFLTTTSGILYISLTFLFLIILRNFSSMEIISGINSIDIKILLTGKEPQFLLSILISIWICDSAAYFTGKSIGKHKLFPSVSPKKTWEGAVGGFLGAIISFMICANLPILLGDFPISHSLIIGIIIGVLGQVGDLAESKLKRDAGIKDSSALIPGHGGVLDRFDSIMFVVPSVVIYLIIASTVNFI